MKAGREGRGVVVSPVSAGEAVRDTRLVSPEGRCEDSGCVVRRGEYCLVDSRSRGFGRVPEVRLFFICGRQGRRSLRLWSL